MSNRKAVELKPFVPARDYDLSKRFYRDLGFEMAWDGGDLAYFRHSDVSFLLQNFYLPKLADKMMIQLLVEDVDAWRYDIERAGVAERYGVDVSPVQEQMWRLRDFTIFDPSGVLWRIAQNI